MRQIKESFSRTIVRIHKNGIENDAWQRQIRSWARQQQKFYFHCLLYRENTKTNCCVTLNHFHLHSTLLQLYDVCDPIKLTTNCLAPVFYIFFFHFHCSRSYINSLLHAFHSFLSSICNNDCCWLNLTCMESSSIIHDTHQCWQHLGTLSPRFSEFGPTHVWIRTICLVLRHSCFPNNRHLHNLRGKICMRINVS